MVANYNSQFTSSSLSSRIWRCNSLWWYPLGGWCVGTSFSHCHLLHPGCCRHHLCCGMPHIQLHVQEQEVRCYKIVPTSHSAMTKVTLDCQNGRRLSVGIWLNVKLWVPCWCFGITASMVTLFSLRLIRLSSYNLNYLIGCGAVILYMAIYSYIIPTTNPQVVAALCNVGTVC